VGSPSRPSSTLASHDQRRGATAAARPRDRRDDRWRSALIVGRLLRELRVLPYTRYTRTQLLDLARRAASQHAVAEIPYLGVAFDFVAIRRQNMCV